MVIKKENLVILVGFGLIIMVGLFTFIKPSLVRDDKSENKNENFSIKTFPRISPADLKTATQQKNSLFIVDVRSEEGYRAEHIVDSVNIPIDTIAPLDNLDNTKSIIVVAEDTVTADQAAALFEDKNFSEIKVLEGGFAGWKSSGGQAINWGDPTSFVNQSKVSFLDQADLKKMLDEKRNIEIIDVRAKADFNEFIPGAKNIPLDELEARRSEISIGKEIVVYGNTELEGFMAGVRLYDMNFLSCYVLRGGFEGWKENSFPIEKK